MSKQDSSFLGTAPVRPLLLKLAWPAMVSMAINMLYNLVDRIYIGNGVGTAAQAGLALTMPLMIILAAFGMMAGVGTSAIISIYLGEQRKQDAERVLGQLLFLCILSIFTLQFSALVFLDEILLCFGGNDQITPYARDYLKIILWGGIFSHLSFSLAAQMRAEGNSKKCMMAILIGAISNILLDPLFIFVFKMGIAGAAYATVLSMIFSSAFVLRHFILGLGTLKLHMRHLCPNARLLWRIIAIGLAPCCMQLAAGAINIAANHCFNAYSESPELATEGIACWSIVHSINFIFLTPLIGLAQGMQPIIGYNFGARNWLRVRNTFKTALMFGFCITASSAIILYCFAPCFVRCFSQQESLIEMGTTGIRTMMVTFSLIAMDILTLNYFQAIGRASLAIFLSLQRQVIFFLPALVILAHFAGIAHIWWCQPISDTTAFLCSSTLTFFTLRKLRRQADEQQTHAADD